VNGSVVLRRRALLGGFGRGDRVLRRRALPGGRTGLGGLSKGKPWSATDAGDGLGLAVVVGEDAGADAHATPRAGAGVAQLHSFDVGGGVHRAILLGR
jgi:hypothetical protein